jgi:hypothetical protein
VSFGDLVRLMVDADIELQRQAVAHNESTAR